jgi:hypothetical protein
VTCGGGTSGTGGKAPTQYQSSWPASAVPSNKSPQYPKRSLGQTEAKDNRYLVTGWVNGNFYGYPKGDCNCVSDSSQCQGGINESQGKGTYTSNNQTPYCTNCNAWRGGVPGIDPETGKICYGKNFTASNPLVYYDLNGDAIYSTYYGKKLNMDEETALKLAAEMYSCGDTGWENSDYNWPFGSYFSYGQDLGGIGKGLFQQGNYANPGYALNSAQFTMTPTAFDSEDFPAYDFELMWFPIAWGQGNYATCVSAVTLDFTADLDQSSDEERGQGIKLIAGANKGLYGGYVPVDSIVGQSAKPFIGTQMGVSNFTNLQQASFEIGQPNQFNAKITNQLSASQYCKS